MAYKCPYRYESKPHPKYEVPKTRRPDENPRKDIPKKVSIPTPAPRPNASNIARVLLNSLKIITLIELSI